MNKDMSATFQITICATENSTWQGFVECDGERREFKSELQLLQHMVNMVPLLSPENQQMNWSTPTEQR